MDVLALFSSVVTQDKDSRYINYLVVRHQEELLRCTIQLQSQEAVRIVYHVSEVFLHHF